jgi:PAS domain S-box-containing protein
LGSAFDLSPYGIGVVGLDGRWLEINDAYCRMLGYERSELVGTSFRDFTHPEDVAEDRDFLAAAIAGELDSSDREKRYVRKNGSALWARVRAEIVRDESGEPRYFVSHLQEITERRAAQELQRLSERTLR